MPQYKYSPEPGNMSLTVSTFEVFDPETGHTNTKKILKGETFNVDHYLSENVANKAGLIFVDDEPYVSPIICSFSGSGSNEMEVPDFSGLIDVYVSMASGGSVDLFFNGDEEHKITIYQSGTVFRSILLSKIRTVNTNGSSNYTVALLEANQFNANGTTI